MISPIAVGSVRVSKLALRCYSMNLQLCGGKLLHDISWLGIKYPEKCFVRETRDFLSHPVNVVHRVALR